MSQAPASADRVLTVRQALTEATAFFQGGKWDDVETICRPLVAAHPKTANAWQLLGLIEYRRGHHPAAAEHLRQAVELRPQEAEFHANLAIVLQADGQRDAAMEHYRRAVDLKPNYPEAHSNMGSALAERGELEAAAAAFRAAIAHKADYVQAHFNLGHVLQDLNRPYEALSAYRQAVAIQPGHDDAQWGMSWVLLLTGDYRTGWQKYEHRFRTNPGQQWGVVRPFTQPRWQGEPLAGRTLLVHCEQGMGDTIQFCRYVPLLGAFGGRVVLECQPELVRLLGSLKGCEQVVPRPSDLGIPACAFDCYLPLLSLPNLLGTTLETVPAEMPYLRADPARVRAWGKSLRGPGLRVGLVWSGNPGNPNDHNRSCPLASFAPLGAIPGIRWFSLQKGPAAAETNSPPPGLALTALGDRLGDFAETTAVLAQLDLVISVDTAVAHLAGALGRPVWNLLPFASDWRWLLDRMDSPWYPTMRLFRQTRRKDWTSVLPQVAEALQAWARQQPWNAGDAPSLFPSEPKAPDNGEGTNGDQPSPQRLVQQGVAAFQAGRRQDGLRLLRRAAERAPEDAEVQYNLSVALQSAGHKEGAVDHYYRALVLGTATPEIHFNLGNAVRDRGQPEQAILHYRRALALQPAYRKAHTNLANLLFKQGQTEAAADHYRQARDLDPSNAAGQLNLGTALHRLGQHDEAAVCLRQALTLQPNSAEAAARLGVVLDILGQAEEGIALLRKAVALRPDDAEARHNLAALLLRHQGLSPEVSDHLERAVALRPEWVVARHSRAQALLMAGDFERGFTEYEWRWQLPSSRPLPLTQPSWDGTPCPGRTVMLWAEQGLGDTIQFARYAVLVARQGSRVVVGCPAALVRLLETLPDVARVSDCVEALEPFDFHAPLLSLPRLLGTTLATIPSNVPYVQPPADETRTLQTPPGTRLRVGLVWAGNPAHPEDRRRSCPVALFGDLVNVPGVAFWSLQHGTPADDRARFDPTGQRLRELGQPFEDFAVTAGVIAQLDLVISVDTATAHLAGALGKPVWLLLPFAADWRWLRDRENSPWYPTMRLFRQRRLGDWEELLNRVTHALGIAAAGGSREIINANLK